LLQLAGRIALARLRALALNPKPRDSCDISLNRIVALIGAANVLAPWPIAESRFEQPNDLTLEVMAASARALACC
jgi:hypothetical protein